jgi:hypothetical protein
MVAFLNVYWWEFLQNLPFVMAVIVSMRLWSTGQPTWSILTGLAGCVASAAAITLTEPYKLRTTSGQGTPSRELGFAAAIRELATNSLTFAGGTLLAALYFGRVTHFGSLPNNWLPDVAVGGMAGGAIGAIQCAGPHKDTSASNARPHIVAFVVMGPVVLGMARLLVRLPTLPEVLEGSVCLALLMTLIICCVEYGPSLKAS